MLTVIPLMVMVMMMKMNHLMIVVMMMIMLMVDILLMNQQVIELWKVYVTTLQMRWVEEVVCHTRKSFVMLYLSFIFTLDFVFMKL
ncbi:unnamed protein product [Brassica oleracea]|uniref:(rape) hypothetical protein n=1 Tax=Brassica napus TaxID=3708 RepID=A0A816IUB0_BRANA|nr:unnamed protein product [Brassica napus]